MNAIETRELCKVYGDTKAVDHLNLTVAEGELFALLGVNGAGKTTTVKLLSCLTKPTEGDAFLLGHSILHDSAGVKQIIGISPQETAVAPRLTVEENLRFFCGIHGFSKEKTAQKVQELMEKLGLDSVRKKYAGKLSGGWQRRLSIALALIGEPKILFLDEPTLGLDVLARSALWEVISALKGTITVILTTHYMEEAEALADHVAVMAEGHILAWDTPAGLKEKNGADSLEQAFIQIVKGAGACA